MSALIPRFTSYTFNTDEEMNMVRAHSFNGNKKSRFKGSYLNYFSRTRLLSSSAFIVAGLFLLSSPAGAVDDYADWDGVQITNGSATVNDTGLGKTEIEQHSTRAIGEAQELHIGRMGEVNIKQGSKDALFVGRVVGDHDDPTQILGNLSADGRVMIIDRNGVFFGADSKVDAAGVAVTTGDVTDSQIMSGANTLTFDNFGSGSIVNEGTISVKDAGVAAFVSPNFRNSGVISAKMGNVVVGSGQKVSLDLYGDGLVEVAVSGEVEKALIENKGRIEAEGGTVQLTAGAAKNLIGSVINNDGIVSASSATLDGGKIVLSAGEGGYIKNSGDLKASGSTGGNISVTAKDIDVTQSAKIINTGNGGKTHIKADKKASFKGILASGSNSTNEISGAELSLGGSIEVGEGSHVSFDPVSFDVGAGEAATLVSALNNNGVTVDVEAEDKITVNSEIDSSAQVTNAVLNFKDQNSNNDLQVDLNAKIKLGASQDLTGDASVVNVANGASIQNGVDVSASGATVNVAAGTYLESVNVDRSLTLKGANSGIKGFDPRYPETRIASTGFGEGFFITADNVTIDGFRLSANGFDGILADNVNHLHILNNVIQGGVGMQTLLGDSTKGDNGIETRGGSDIIIERNYIGRGNRGIASFGGNEIHILDNLVGYGSRTSFRDGIYSSEGVNGWFVSGNTVNGVVGDGIEAEKGLAGIYNTNIYIDGNTILNVGGAADPSLIEGINIDGAYGDVIISNNSLTDVTGNGIEARNTDYLEVTDNTLSGIGHNGILVRNSKRSVLGGNAIDALEDGIRLEGTLKNNITEIYDSEINAGDDGIEIGTIGEDAIVAIYDNSNINGVKSGIEVNKINSPSAKSGLGILGNTLIEGGEDGVSIGNINTASLAIVGNTDIKGARHGINFAGTIKNSNSSVLIGDDGAGLSGSRITSINGDGIHFDKNVENSKVIIGQGSVDFESITFGESGTIDSVDGVQITSGNDSISFDSNVKNAVLDINSNIIDSSDNGIEFSKAVLNSNVSVSNNEITSDNDGIDFDDKVEDSAITIGGSLPEANLINSGQSGIEFGQKSSQSFKNVTVNIGSNTIIAHDNGAAFQGTLKDSHININDNNIEADDTGISALSGTSNSGATAEISGNTVFGKAFGISLKKFDQVTLTDNDVHGSVNVGVRVAETSDLDAINNTIYDNSIGMEIKKVNSSTLTQNEISDNTLYGLLAGSGNSDILLSGNVFTNNLVGARFESGLVDLTNILDPNVFTVSGGLSGTQIGMQFDGGSSLSLKNNTLGKTEFNGFGSYPVGDAYYVRFEDGAILDSITFDPVVIDGTFASWDGFVPDVFANVVPAVTLQSIEDRLHDADDAAIDGRGQIFAGIAQ